MAQDKKARVHFAALIKLNGDSDLLPFFIAHYNALELDNYALFLHESPVEEENRWAKEACARMGWKCRMVPLNSAYGNGRLRHVLLSKYSNSISPQDYLITANADEFQEWADSPKVAMVSGADMVLGKRVDRYNVKLIPPDYGNPLEGSYPHVHDNLSKIIFPKKPVIVDKIVMARAKLPVDYSKSARILGNEKFSIRSGVPIHHYHWRHGLLEKEALASDGGPEYLAALENFFK